MARILGLDVGTTAVRGVVLRTALRKVEVERYVEAPLAQPIGVQSNTEVLVAVAPLATQVLARSIRETKSKREMIAF